MRTFLIIMSLTVAGDQMPIKLPFGHQNVFYNENRASLDSIKIKSQIVSIIFWNVENLYDPYDDTTTLDDEFTSSGAKRWTWSKFGAKLNRVAKTLVAAGAGSPPAVVGLCEIENRYVMNKLIHETPLKALNYKFVHHDSPDRRGVDVAMLYRPDLFNVLQSRCIRIRFPFDTLAQTREILLVSGVLFSDDTLSILINHWPSRRGGYRGSLPRRNYVASVLRKTIDSIQREQLAANILVMGDFNDEPENESLKTVLRARTDSLPCHDSLLYNLMGIRNKKRMEGTLKYRDQWSTFDQFVVSGALLQGSSGIKSTPVNAAVVKAAFLLEEDETYFGEKLNRTYTGPRYHGGFSDHLPIRLEIIRIKP